MTSAQKLEALKALTPSVKEYIQRLINEGFTADEVLATFQIAVAAVEKQKIK